MKQDSEQFQLSQISDRRIQSHQITHKQEEDDDEYLTPQYMQPIRIMSHDQNFTLKCFTIIIILIVIILASLHYSTNRKDIDHSPFQQQTKNHRPKNDIYDIKHDQKCFTQGLAFINDTHLLQTCGLYKQSYFHIYQVKQDETTLKLSLTQTHKSLIFQDKYFLQGGCYFPKTGKFYILTWMQGAIFVYSKSLQLQKTVKWQGQGWGITHNNSHLIISNGSQFLIVVNQQLQIVQTIKVTTLEGNPKHRLNELQWIIEDKQQYILANIFLDSYIVKIHLSTGKIVKQYDFLKLTSQYGYTSQHVLNGIAYHQATGQYLVTGKKWNQIYLLCQLQLDV